MSDTPPRSNAGTPLRPQELDHTSNSSPTKHTEKEEKDDLMTPSDDNDDDEEVVNAKEAKMLEDDLLSPVTSDLGSDTERVGMEKELEEQGLIRKPEGTSSKRSRHNGRDGKGKEKENGGKGKKDQNLPESDIVARWNRDFGDVCQVGVKA